MKKAPLQPDADGSFSVKLRVPPDLWARALSIAGQLGCPGDVNVALMQVQTLLLRLSTKLAEGDTTWAGPEWKGIDTTPTLTLSPRVASPSADELEALFPSTKAKSGWYGVYPNGRGWRALARNKGGGQVYIGQFQDATMAATVRLRYHRANGLPYGRDEEEIDALRRKGVVGTDEQLLEMVRDAERLASGGMIGFDNPPVD